MSVLNEDLVLDRVRKALEKIASVGQLDGKTLINIPVMYPSGAMATVEIDINNERCWVSDMGFGLVEAEYLGASEQYAAAAKTASNAYGVQFDGDAIYALWVPIGRLESAIVCVANASNRAATEAIRLASEQKSQRKNEEVFERIKRTFGSENVAKTADIRGKHVTWSAHNVVVFPDRRRAVFEYMTKHAVSASSKFFMFSDLKNADAEISLNAVVADIDVLDEKAQMVGDIANIIPLTAADDEFRRYARSA